MPGVDIPPERKVYITEFRVKYKDFFDLKKFYEDLHDWLKEHDFTDVQDKMDHYEVLFLEKIDTASYKEQWIRWRPQKVPLGSSYYRFWIDFDYHNVGIGKADIVKQGKKFKVNKGEIELSVKVWMELDYKEMFVDHPILKFFHKLFTERIFRRDLFEDHKKEIYRESREMENWIKHWFKMKRHLPYEESGLFFEGHSWPTHKKEG